LVLRRVAGATQALDLERQRRSATKPNYTPMVAIGALCDEPAFGIDGPSR
jgi:hypothetical protein